MAISLINMNQIIDFVQHYLINLEKYVKY